MPPLDNPRWERFAQELAKGQSQTGAYLAAGYKGAKSPTTAASRLLTNVKILERVRELQERGAARAEVFSVAPRKRPRQQPSRAQHPICLSGDACALGSAERAGNALYGARVDLKFGGGFRTLMPPSHQVTPVLSSDMRSLSPSRTHRSGRSAARYIAPCA
jgi:hypothetical protein